MCGSEELLVQEIASRLKAGLNPVLIYLWVQDKNLLETIQQDFLLSECM